jgi:hypothetical protein
MRFEAINNVIILLKDRGEVLDSTSQQNDLRQIPPPYTGVIDSVGYEECGYKVGEKIAFDEVGGLMLSTDFEDYVVITPDMVIGVL